MPGFVRAWLECDTLRDMLLDARHADDDTGASRSAQFRGERGAGEARHVQPEEVTPLADLLDAPDQALDLPQGGAGRTSMRVEHYDAELTEHVYFRIDVLIRGAGGDSMSVRIPPVPESPPLQ